MGSERNKIQRLFSKLRSNPKHRFPAKGWGLDAVTAHGVYIISKGKAAFHVGRTTRARKGLYQRLRAHLMGRSSFTKAWFNRDGDKLREIYSYQFIVVSNPRHRALLEAYATGCLCPKHMGTGEYK